MKKLEAQLGIVSQQLREVTFQADAKNLPQEVQQKKNRDAKSLIRKLNLEKKIREEKKSKIE